MVVYFGVSRLRVEQSPRYGANFIEVSQCAICSVPIDGSGVGQKAKVAVDLLCRAVRDSPVAESVSTGPPVACCFDGLAVDDEIFD